MPPLGPAREPPAQPRAATGTDGAFGPAAEIRSDLAPMTAIGPLPEPTPAADDRRPSPGTESTR